MFKWSNLAQILNEILHQKPGVFSCSPFKEAYCLPESILKVTISSDDKAVPFNEILISNFMDFVTNHIWLAHIFTAHFN